MVDAADGADLIAEHPAHLTVDVEALVQDLDRDRAIDIQLGGAIHGTEAALCDDAMNPQPTPQVLAREIGLLSA
jgi:hypothetical protein